ncbi:MAG TPA: PVC-type heme-binding CxxCH protein [Flavitalea sp.]|nr:PVC-type heme-binding CxxCH protein [Flavitalea sp.]
MLKYLLLVILIFTLTECSEKKASPPSGNVSAANALATFQLADGFKIEMVASEPLVTDPVDMEIDENGRMYVVEMHGYPLDKSGSGNIIVLSDEDGDGKMDKRIVFKDSLVLPTSILRWKKGLLVTDSPNLLYLEDTDGDGHANITDTILHGFALTNPQHNMNNPIYGIDNWIYIAHEGAVGTREYKEEFGDEGEEIVFYRDSNAVRLPRNAGGRSVRVRPEKKQLEMLSSRCQFGHTFDEWGRRFNCNNSNQGYQEVIAQRYFERNPNMFVSQAVQSMSDHRDAAEVFPTTIHPDRQILTDPGVLTSACGLTTYMGNSFPGEYNNNVTFVAEPVSNLVHVDKLRDSGATFVASRVLQNKEFLSSTDSWSRPVNFYIGPDGALYMLDYYRKVIESPEWMSDEAIKSGGLYDGADKGRIYRITAKNVKKADWTKGLNLGKSSIQELVKTLSNGNYWWRINAQRLLVDRADKKAVPLLSDLLQNGTSIAKLHALWTLDGLGGIINQQIITALKDPDARIRENAIQIAEKYLDKSPDMAPALIAMKNDNDAKVRFQLLLTLGFVNTPQAAEARNNILFRDINDKWVQIAALSASSLNKSELLDRLTKQSGADQMKYASLTERLTTMIGASGSRNEIEQLIRKASLSGNTAILKGVSDGFRNRKSSLSLGNDVQVLLINTFFESGDAERSGAILTLLKENNIADGELKNASIKKAVALMKDTAQDYRKRAAAIKFLELGSVAPYGDDLKKLIVPNEEPVVQMAALNALSKVKGTVVSEYAIKQWPVMTPEIRSVAVNTFLEDSARIVLLIDALDQNIINTSSVPFGTSVELMQNTDSVLRRRARNIFTKNERERKRINKEYQASLEMEGNATNGKEIFVHNCAICHQVRGKIGVAIGPDLGTVHNWVKEDLLANILDPNMGIASGYDTWHAVLNDGTSVQGIIAEETPAAITFRNNNMQDKTLSRQDMKSLKALNTSLMPSGFEKSINKQQMADLMAFLKSRE